MDKEAIYLQLGQLFSEMPSFEKGGQYHHIEQLDEHTLRWLGRASALVEQVCSFTEFTQFQVAATNIVGALRDQNVHAVKTILSIALARAESRAPVAAQGAYIGAGAQFDLYQSFEKIFSTANQTILLIDPYIDQVVLTSYASLANEGVGIRLLGDESRVDCASRLQSAMQSWVVQYGKLRPVEVRTARKGMLHDRVIIVDNGLSGWTIGQSFKDIAKKSPTAFVKIPAEVLREKNDYYERIWNESTNINHSKKEAQCP